MQADPITAAAKQAAREALAAERDAALSRAEAAERERDALLVVARAGLRFQWHMRNWMEGHIDARNALFAALDSLPPEVRAELDQSE